MAQLEQREAHLLRILGRRRYLDRWQIQRLWFPDRQPWDCQVVLRTLANNGFVSRATFRPLVGGVVGEYNTPYVYWLTAKGASFVEREFGEKVDAPRGRESNQVRQTYDPFVEHTLAVNTFWQDLTLAWREGGDWAGLDWWDEWGQAVLRYQGDTGLQEFRPDAFISLWVQKSRDEAGLPPVVVARGRVGRRSRHEGVLDWPAFFPEGCPPRQAEGGSPPARACAFIEFDRGKESGKQWDDKMKRYHKMRLRQDWIQHYGVPTRRHPQTHRLEGVWPGLLVITRTVARTTTIISWVREAYDSWVLVTSLEMAALQGRGLVQGDIWQNAKTDLGRLPLVEALRSIGRTP